MKMEHYLAAYDRETDDFLSWVSSVPDTDMRRVKEIAHVASTDPDAMGSYPLSNAQAYEILKLLNRSVVLTPEMVLFLEPAATAREQS